MFYGRTAIRQPGFTFAPHSRFRQAMEGLMSLIKPNLGMTRRTAIKGAAIGAAFGAISPNITFAQDASPAASPSADVVPSGVDGVPDAYLKYPEPKPTYDGVPGS